MKQKLREQIKLEVKYINTLKLNELKLVLRETIKCKDMRYARSPDDISATNVKPKATLTKKMNSKKRDIVDESIQLCTIFIKEFVQRVNGS